MFSRGNRFAKHTDLMQEYLDTPIDAVIPGLDSLLLLHIRETGRDGSMHVAAIEDPSGYFHFFFDPPFVAPVVEEWLWYRLSQFHPTVKNSKAYQQGFDSGLRTFYQIRWSRLPVGLVHELEATMQDLQAMGIRTTIKRLGSELENAPVPTLPKQKAKLVEYEPWQKTAIQQILTHRRGLIAAPVNFGKTEVILKAIHERRVPTIITAPLKSIIDDAFSNVASRFPGWNIVYMHSDKVTTTVEEIENAAILATTPKKFLNWIGKNIRDPRARKALLRFRQLFIDECHECLGSMYEKIRKFVNPFYIYGLSGTVIDPLHEYNTWEILEQYGPMLYEDKTIAMVERGVSADFTVEFHSPVCVEPSTYRSGSGRIHKDRLPASVPAEKDLARSLWRNQKVLKYIADDIAENAAQGKQTLCVCTKLNVWEPIRDAITRYHRDLRVVSLTGTSHSDVRKEALAKFKAGKIDAMIVTNIFDMGVNLPSIDVLWLPQPINPEFWQRMVQRIGRCLRKRNRSADSDESRVVRVLSYEHSERYHKRHQHLRELLVDGFGFKVQEVMK